MKPLLIAVCFPLLALIGCTPDPDMAMTKKPPAQNESRISVTRIGIFEDDLAYNERRGIYLIHDTATGADYIGVSGIGITEVGIHPQGKSLVHDER